MLKTDIITAEYVKFIGTEVINNFGGSYQNYETTGKEWRQKIDYNPVIEDFVICKTNLFLRTRPANVQSDFNMMYNVCYNISDHLSEYLVKKSPDLTRKAAINNVWNKIFFNSKAFQVRFKQTYKRPIDLADKEYCKANQGIVSMYLAVKKARKCK